MVEIIGMIGSFFIIFSLIFKTRTFKGTMLMRIINALGGLMFTIYGILIPAYATIFTNSICCVLNIGYCIYEYTQHNKEKKVDNK